MFNFFKNPFAKKTDVPETASKASKSSAPMPPLVLSSLGQSTAPQIDYLSGAWKAEKGYTQQGSMGARFPVIAHGKTVDEVYALLKSTIEATLGRGELVVVEASVEATQDTPESKHDAIQELAHSLGVDIGTATAKASKPNVYPFGYRAAAYITSDEQFFVNLSCEFGRGLMDTDIQVTNVSVTIDGFDVELIRACLDAVNAMTIEIKVPKKLTVNFWMMTGMGPMPRARKIDVPSWDEVKDAYPTDVENAASQVMVHPKRDSGVMLWHGPPGTGKTTAIRSLMKEWAEWGATVHLISDPEKMLNDASYLTSVMEHTQRRIGEDSPPVLIVLEDSGELITSDAKTNAGQALSRLLNMTDGILGQNENIYVLITTNEPLTSLHGAVTRPGRCISNIDFHKLAPQDIADWCAKNDEPYEDGYMDLEEATLAELYAMKDDFGVVTNIDVTAGIATKEDVKKQNIVETVTEVTGQTTKSNRYGSYESVPVDSPAPSAEAEDTAEETPQSGSPLDAAADALSALADTVSPDVLEQVTAGTDTTSTDSPEEN